MKLREYLKEMSGGQSNSIYFNYRDSFSIYADKTIVSNGLVFVSNLSLDKTVNESYEGETFDVFAYGKTLDNRWGHMPLYMTVSTVEEAEFLVKKLQTYVSQ